jgi:hypothetical protein
MIYVILTLIGIIAIWPAVMIIGEVVFQLSRIIRWIDRRSEK